MIIKLVCSIVVLYLFVNKEPQLAISASHKATDTFCIVVSNHIKNGKVIITKSPRDSDATSYIFSFSPASSHYYDDAGFFLDIQNRKEKKFNLKRYKKLTVYQIMDSLKVNDRSFFRKNIFYAILDDGRKRSFYKLKGEYIHMSYKGEDADNR